MKLYCPACSQALAVDDLCGHDSPVCEACCPDEHPSGYYDEEAA